MRQPFPRRRFIAVAAAAGGLPLLSPGTTARAESTVTTWHGIVLGAEASMRIHHPDPETAHRLIALSLSEARRLERIFSLYLDDSALVELNRRGALAAPPPELVDLLGECCRLGDLTAGAFDVTVQPLWRVYHDHFSRPHPDPSGPPRAAIDRALASVGRADVLVSPDRIAFRRRGMALTLNGIAQGYITDRVVALLHAHGIDHSLVDMGEARAIGTRADGRPWQVAIAAPACSDRASCALTCVDQAVATSGGYGFQFDAEGRFNHLFDPRTGTSSHRYSSVTVVMPTAAAADGLSTAFSLMPIDDIHQVVRGLETGEVHVVAADGRSTVLRA